MPIELVGCIVCGKDVTYMALWFLEVAERGVESYRTDAIKKKREPEKLPAKGREIRYRSEATKVPAQGGDLGVGQNCKCGLAAGV